MREILPLKVTVYMSTPKFQSGQYVKSTYNSDCRGFIIFINAKIEIDGDNIPEHVTFDTWLYDIESFEGRPYIAAEDELEVWDDR